MRRRLIITTVGVTQIFAWGSSFYLPAVLSAPIAAETGWPLPLVVGGFSVGLALSALVSPLVGRLIARHGGRPVLAVGALLLAAGQLTIAAAPHPAVFLAGWLVLGAAMGASLYDAAFSTLAGIFGAAARKAIVAVTLFGGFASTVCWPLSAALLSAFGWRGALLSYAGLQFAVCLPAILLVLPRQARGGPASAPVDARPLAGAEARQFRILAAMMTVNGMVMSTVSVYVIGLLSSGGAGPEAAVALAALIGPAQVAGRIVEMLLGSRFQPIWTLLASTLLTTAGTALMLAGAPVAAVALILYGAGNGIWSIVRGTLPLALFGPERYAPIMGRLARPGFLAMAATPAAAAPVIAALQPAGSWLLLAGLCATNVLLALLLLAVLRRRPA